MNEHEYEKMKKKMEVLTMETIKENGKTQLSLLNYFN